MLKFFSEITGWGNDALFFLEVPDANFIILFNESAPPELADISVLHTETKLLMPPEKDDILIIANKAFTITAVGEEAIHTCVTSVIAQFVLRGKQNRLVLAVLWQPEMFH
ncbi:MAG: PTS glucitol/sorbitol transporter subunit IIA [Mitsuokella sp.]